MKIEINKTYSLTIWQIINRIAGIAALVAMLYYTHNEDYQKATFYSVIYLILIVCTMKDALRCDCEEDEENTSN